jgi:drug/metabolite transporter (DMT)-like permease
LKRSSWALFILIGVIWGIPYFFTKIAVDANIPVPLIVFARVFIGSLILVPIAHYRKVLIPALRHWKVITLYGFGEMVFPWFLIGTGQKTVPSSTAALLIATVPLWASIFAFFYGDKTVWQRKRLIGLISGFIGIFFLVGFDGVGEGSSTGQQAIAVAFLITAAILYAGSVSMINNKIPEVSGLAIHAIALSVATIAYLPTLFFVLPTPVPPLEAMVSVGVLGTICTAFAFIIFFKVLGDIGPARASLTVYINTVVAVLLGVIILSEAITTSTLIGIPLVLIGSYLASRKSIIHPN